MKESIKKHSIEVGLIVCLGKIMGFVKQVIIAWAFGANSNTDTYFAAESYILMFGQIQVYSIAPSILTQYVKLKEKGKTREAEDVANASFLFFPTISVTLIIINILFANYISKILGLSYTVWQQKEIAVFLIELCPIIFLDSITGVVQGILDANNCFFPTKILSLCFSISIIICVITFHKSQGMMALLMGVLIGHIIHTIYIIYITRKYVKFSFKNPFKNSYFLQVIQNFFPLVVGNSIVDFGHLLDKIIASSLVVGSVSTLYYGQVISSDLVNAVVVTSIGPVLLPDISRDISNGYCKEHLIRKINRIIYAMVFLNGIITSLYVVEGKDLVKVIFERGNFGSSSTQSVASVALCYSLGFCFMACREIYTKVHYAYQDTFIPMVNSIFGMIINLIGSVILSKVYGVKGIALATSISMFIVSIALIISFKRHLGVFPINKLCLFNFVKILVAMIIAIFVGKGLYILLFNIQIVFRMVFVVGGMGTIYLVANIVLRFPFMHSWEK